MRIICVEEHVSDVELGKACLPVQRAMAPYTTAMEAAVPRHDAAQIRPLLRPIPEALSLAADKGAGRIAEMDASGIDLQVLSHIHPVQFLPAATAVPLAQGANDRLAEAVRAHPDRFRGLATLPWQEPRAARRELERAVGQLGLVGALINGRPGDSFLDDPAYQEVLAAFDALAVPLYLHPGLPLEQVREPYYGRLSPAVSAFLSLSGWGWHNEAGVQVVRMILGGVFDRFPRLQVISGHWGEMVPFYLGRLDDMIGQEVSGLSRTITATYEAHVHVTPSGMFDVRQFEFISRVIGVGRIIYSVDYPFLTCDGVREFLAALPVDEPEKAQIAHRNAEALFRL